MAEVLSQSQIDALLNAALSGEMSLDEKAEESANMTFTARENSQKTA